jgi:hypothetical protein
LIEKSRHALDPFRLPPLVTSVTAAFQLGGEDIQMFKSGFGGGLLGIALAASDSPPQRSTGQRHFRGEYPRV